jgi:UDP-glucose 4-epimerase
MIKKYKNILVTGGAGYIGSHITHKLNRKIIIIDNLSSGSKKMLNKKAIFINEDIRNTSKISKIIKKFNIDSIIHLAAHISVEESVKNPNKYYNNNIEGTLSILKDCKNIQKFSNLDSSQKEILVKTINNCLTILPIKYALSLKFISPT